MSYTRVSVLIPTRKRVERLRTLLRSYEETKCVAELVFRVDSDDVETQQFLSQTEHQIVVGPRYEGYRSMPLFFNELYAASSGDVLLCGNDDMVFRTHMWDQQLLVAANHFSDGVFNLGVRTHNEEHYPFSCISRRACDQLGFIWDPEIFWGDIFLRDLMAWFDRCVMIHGVEIEHDWEGWAALPDEVFRQSPKSVQQEYWMTVHRPAVERAAMRLQELYDSRLRPSA